jgi:hypothetical protein
MLTWQWEFAMSSVKLDPSKMLGYKILSADAAVPSDAQDVAILGVKLGDKPASTLGMKVGSKPDTKLGAKLGLKVGAKVTMPTSA